MKKALIVIGILLVIGIIVFMIFGDNYGKLMKQYGALVEPAITDIPDQKVIEYKLTGDPSEMAGKAYSALFKTYYSLKGVSKGNAAPKARWAIADIKKKEEWAGSYAIQIPENISNVPEGSDPNIQVVTWKYGKAAEILHIGPWSEETPTIETLKKFIVKSGYKISGEHEEEYIKGPGMFGKGNTKKYITIIRYPIEKAAKQEKKPVKSPKTPVKDNKKTKK